MKRRYTSKLLQSIALAWILAPITYTLFAVFVLSVHSTGAVKLLLSPWYWFVCAASITAGLGILRIQWYGWYAFLFSNFILVYQTAVSLAYHSDSAHKWPLFGGTVFFQLAAIYIVGREIRVPYFSPRIRWWESDPRYKLSIMTKIHRQDQSEYEGEIMDISRGGCFIKTHFYFPPEEKLVLDFALFEQPIRCSGRVIWQTESTVTHPKGVGVRFEGIDKSTLSSLKQATEKLKKLTRAYNQMTRERNWQEYLQREQRYQGKQPPKK